MPCQRAIVKFEYAETHNFCQSQFAGHGLQELAGFRSGIRALPPYDRVPADMMTKKNLQLCFCLQLCFEMAKRYPPGLLQLVPSPPRMILSQQGTEHSVPVFSKDYRLVAL